MDVEEPAAHDYCRELEAYLCRKNEGHLIRIVGPAFERICGWAEKGIPFKVACRGIDRYFERYYAKGTRRRPVRIEFCEADVLDVFDEWRRAVGVGVASETPAHRGPSLPEHLDRVIARLTTLRSGTDAERDAVIDRAIREIDVARAGARSLRGAARAAFLERLRAIDADLLAAFRIGCAAATLEAFARDADAELAGYRERMPADAYAQAHAACVDRLLREHARLPVLSLD
jgi:hypothetical protein